MPDTPPSAAADAPPGAAAERAAEAAGGREEDDSPAGKVRRLEADGERLRAALRDRPQCKRTRDLIAVNLVDLGTNLKFAGRTAEGIAKYRESLTYNRSYAPAWYNLGVAAGEAGERDEAARMYTTTLELNPCCFEAMCNLGLLYKEAGYPEQAVHWYRKALKVQPYMEILLGHLASGLTDWATKLLNAGQRDQALPLYQEALMCKPDHAEAYYCLGVAYGSMPSPHQAIFHYRLAVLFRPDYPQAWHNLGDAYRSVGAHEHAANCFQKAIDNSGGSPEFAVTMNRLAMMCAQNGRMDQAISLLREAVGLQPSYAEAHNNLGVILRDEGKMQEALDCYDRCLELCPEAENAAQNKLLALNFSEEHDVAAVQRAHLDWGRRIIQRFGAVSPPPFANDRSMPRKRPLRVGYVSPDFYLHSVSYFAHHLLRHHDPARVEPHCFANVAQADSKTFAFQRLVDRDRWHDIHGKDAQQCCGLIRSLQIDVLVDLTGHTASCRLDIFAQKPAPVQVTWIGYPNTTGLPTIDYRITDPYADPAHVSPEHYAETLYRLPQTFLCYCPDTPEYYSIIEESPEPNREGATDLSTVATQSFQTRSELLEADQKYVVNYRGDLAPHVSPPPFLDNGYVTFGSFNNMAKINRHVARAWAEILRQVPGSRLLLKSKPFAEARIREETRKLLGAEGADLARVDLVGLVPGHYNHLQYYEKLDIAVDCFPYAGTTTSCEALWMGVPMVTMRGDAHATNVGASLMTSLGLTELVADSVADYVRVAAELGRSPARMRELRSGLRRRMALSPLCDGKSYVRHVEDAFDQMWEAYAKDLPKVTGAPGLDWAPAVRAPQCFEFTPAPKAPDGGTPAAAPAEEAGAAVRRAAAPSGDTGEEAAAEPLAAP